MKVGEFHEAAMRATEERERDLQQQLDDHRQEMKER